MKQTTKEPVEQYCKTYNIEIKSGDGAIFLLPFITIIAALDIYNDKIMPMPLRGEAKYARKMWAQEFHKFERILTFAFNLDHLGEIGDLTDGLEEYIAADMTKLRETILTNLPLSSQQKREQIIDALLVNVLTQTANVMWEDIYGKQCPVLTNMEHIALRICDRLQPHLERSTFHNPQQVEEAVSALCTTQINYLENKIRS